MNISGMALSFFTSDGPGGMTVITVVVVATIIYFFLIRYIIRGGQPKKK